jgi:hypothetical protein
MTILAEPEISYYGCVTDPDEIAAIAARVRFAQRSWWDRLHREPPLGWCVRQTRFDLTEPWCTTGGMGLQNTVGDSFVINVVMPLIPLSCGLVAFLANLLRPVAR